MIIECCQCHETKEKHAKGLCYSCYKKNLYQKYSEKYKEKSKNFYEENKDEINEERRENYISDESVRKQCSIFSGNYYQNNSEKLKEISREFYEKNKEEINKKNKLRYENNKKVYNLKRKEWRENNKEQLKISKKLNYEKNKEQILIKCAIYHKNRLETDIEYKIKCWLSSRIRQAIKNQSSEKAYKTKELIGCDMEFFRQYIEHQFKEGMSWENYGKNGWHLDHIIPCSSFLLEYNEQQKLCFHYTNYQPLWAKENFSKGNRIIEEELTCSTN
jgi:hypothetical protein